MGSEANIIAALITVFGVFATIWYNLKMHRDTKRQVVKVTEAAVISDIRSITLALYNTKLIDSFITSYQNGTFPPWADSPGKADYFQLFGAIASEVGNLPLELAQGSVAFYTFLKIARDAAEPFGELRNNLQKTNGDTTNVATNVKEHAKKVLIAMQYCMEAAEYVLRRDVSDQCDIVRKPGINEIWHLPWVRLKSSQESPKSLSQESPKSLCTASFLSNVKSAPDFANELVLRIKSVLPS